MLAAVASVHFISQTALVDVTQFGLAAPFKVDPAFDVNVDTQAIVAPEITSNTALEVALDAQAIVKVISGTRWPAAVADDVPAITLAPFSVFSFIP